MLLKIKKALESKFVVPCVFAVAFVLWLLGNITEGNGYNEAILGFLVLTVLSILCFCDDVKNIYCPVLYAGLCIQDITTGKTTESTLKFYAGCVIVTIIFFIIFSVVKIIKNRNNLKLGKMFYPLVVLDITFLLGGIFCNFQVETFFVTLGLSVAILLLYFFAVNFTTELSSYFAYLFISGAFLAALQILVNNFISNGFTFSGIFYMTEPWITAEGPNTAAIFFGLGAVSSLSLISKKKHGYLFFIPTIFFVLMIIITVCRGMLLTICIVLPVEFVFIYRKSNDKKTILYSIFCVITILSFFELTLQCLSDPLNRVYDKFLSNGTSGRIDGLWDWCIGKFLEHPMLGYGFLADAKELVPYIRGDLRCILAHNTFIQYLVSVGIIGSILALYFYIEKYHLIITDFYGTLHIIFAIFTIALSGMTDQAAVTDPFIFTTTILLLSAKEKDLAQKGIEFTPLINFNKKYKKPSELM